MRLALRPGETVIGARGRIIIREKQRSELAKCPLVDPAFKENDVPDSLPIVQPHPIVKFGSGVTIEPDALLIRAQLQQEPDLLLADAYRTPTTPDQMPRQPIAQPPASPSQDRHIVLPETDLLVQLAVERVFNRLAILNTALGELPRVFAAAPSPKHPPITISDNKAHVRPETVGINHLARPIAH